MNKLIRPILDVIMLLIILALMAHIYIPGIFHEAIGLCLIAVVGGHLWLSLHNTVGIMRRTFSWFRAACRLVEVLLAANLILLTVTGVSLAHDLFALTAPPLRPSLARPLHRILAHTVLMLVGMHMGLRFPGFLALLGFRRKTSKEHPVKKFFLCLTCGLTAVYGLVAAIRRGYFDIDLASNLMRFENAEEPFSFFLMDLVAIFILAIITGVLLRRFIRRISNNFHERKDEPS